MATYTIEIRVTAEAADYEAAADYGWLLAQELREKHPEIGPIIEIKTEEHPQ